MKKLEFLAGDDISSCYRYLKEESKKINEDTSGEFNGNLIDSTMSLDTVYNIITGKTKMEFEEGQRKWKEDYKRQEREHKESIPMLSKEYIDKGHQILDESFWKYWDEIVPIRLGDLYRGMELRCTLELVTVLDHNNCDLKTAEEIFDKQGHSGMSAGLMFSMMKAFCKRGNEFVQYINK